MKNRILSSLALIALFAHFCSGCASKSPYDVSAAEVQKRRGAPPSMKFDSAAHTAGMSEKQYKKGDTLPDGTVAKDDVMVESGVMHFKKGDVLPDGKIADGDRQFGKVLMKRTK